jgi:anti-sigma factor RsiW
MTAAQLTCRELLDFLDRYLDGELPPDTGARFEAHLRACEECVAYLNSYRQTIRLAAAAWKDAEPVPDDVPPLLIQGVLQAIRRR